jgi:hypothetical protein
MSKQKADEFEPGKIDQDELKAALKPPEIT